MNHSISVLIAFAIIVVVVGIRMWRATREQRFGLVTMWIVPAIFAGLAVAILVGERLTTPTDLILAFLALAIGAAIGLYQGTHTSVRIDKASRAMFVKMSPFGAAIFVAVLAGRFGVRLASGLPQPGTQDTQPGSPGGLVNLVSLLLLFLAVGVVAGLRVYLTRAYNEAQ